MKRDAVTYPEAPRWDAVEFAPSTSRVLRVLVERANPAGVVHLTRDALMEATGLDELHVELGVAVAYGRRALIDARWLVSTTDGGAVLIAVVAPTGETS